MKALVIGLGISGQGAVHFLSRLGYEIVGIDRSLPKRGISGMRFREEREGIPDEPFDLAVLSPGIPFTHPLVKSAQSRGIELIGEAELAMRHFRGHAIGVTGTNGKSTFVSFLEHLFTCCGYRSHGLGNNGKSLTAHLPLVEEGDIVIVELSSFQLEGFFSPVFDVGVVTSIGRDHLDRHRSFLDYLSVKGRLAHLIKPGGSLFLATSLRSYDCAFAGCPRRQYFPEFCLESAEDQREKEGGLDLAFGVACELGVSRRKFREAKNTFIPLPHRVECLGEVDGVIYYNDSKGTNPSAVLYGVNQMMRPTVLIVGGVNKGNQFEEWILPFKGKVRGIFAIGASASAIYHTLRPHYPVKPCLNLEEAFEAAREFARAGEAVLFSPGCASFDQFVNFEERGNQFKQLFRMCRSYS